MDDRNYMEKMAEAIRAVSQKFIDEASDTDNEIENETMRRAQQAFERMKAARRKALPKFD